MASSRKQGFALIVVLFSLAVLAVLFSTASTRTLASLQFNRAEIVAAERLDAQVQIVDALRVLGRPEGDRFNWAGRSVRLQSTGGLVDLNAAAPELLERLLIGFDLTAPERAAALAAYRNWRRQGLRLQRVSDFARITGVAPDRVADIKALATVHSGRSTLSAAQAPLALLAHLTGQTGDRDALAALLPPATLGPATSASVALFDGARRIGVVAFGAGAGAGQYRILTLN